MKFEDVNVPQPFEMKIKLFDYRLTETNLDALASEFYGKVLANFKTSTGEIGIEFDDKENAAEFSRALSCFKIDFGEKNE